MSYSDLPKQVVSHVEQQVDDNRKVDHIVNKFYRGIVNLPLDLDAAESPLEIFTNHVPSVQTLLNTISAPAFNYTTDLANVYTQVHAIGQYLMADRGAAFPANFPPAFEWLRLYTPEEKQMMVKAGWRTRNYHAQLPQFFAALQLVIIFACVDMYLIIKGKFRKISATVTPDTHLQIPYKDDDPTTWKAYAYRTMFNITGIYTATNLDTLTTHLYQTWDSYGFLMPAESVKIAELMMGKFKNFVFDDNLDINHDYYIDLIIENSGWTDEVFGTNFTTATTGLRDLLEKLKTYLTSSHLIYDTIEYNDKFYTSVFPSFKKMMEPVELNTSLLTEWNELKVPWFQIYFGFHYDGVSTRVELIARGWNAANHGNDHVLSLAAATAEDFADANGTMFYRDNAGLNQGATPPDYMHAIIPYGYDEETWKLGLTLGWMYMRRFLGDERLANDLEIDETFNTVFRQISYTEYYDTENNLIRQVFLALDAPANNEWVGWLGCTDTSPFNDLYKPRSRTPGEWNQITDNYLELGIAGGVWTTLNINEPYARLLKILPNIKRSAFTFQRDYFKEIVYKIVNPRIAPPQAQPPSVLTTPDDKKNEEIKDQETMSEKLDKDKKKLEEVKTFQSEQGKPTSVTEDQIKKVEEKADKLNANIKTDTKKEPEDE